MFGTSCPPKTVNLNKPKHPNSKYPKQTLTLTRLVLATNLVTQIFCIRNKSRPQSLSTRNKPAHPKHKYPEQNLNKNLKIIKKQL